jgi:hypothetical protein
MNLAASHNATRPAGYRGRMAVEERERRRPLIVAALGFAILEPRPEPAPLATLKSWLNSWSGIGAVIAGMTWELTPGGAVQRAAWEVLSKGDDAPMVSARP